MRCGWCRRDLTDDEPIYKVPVAWGLKYSKTFGGCVGHVCSNCVKPNKWGDVFANFDRWWSKPEPCARCGHPVIHDRNYRRPKYIACSPACRKSLHNAQARARRRKPTSKRACTVCGGEFMAKRDDACFCSAKCKQRAYRTRSAEC